MKSLQTSKNRSVYEFKERLGIFSGRIYNFYGDESDNYDKLTTTVYTTVNGR